MGDALTRREIEAMPYGSPEQIDAADRWYGRFARWADAREDRYYLDAAIRRLLLREVWYMTQQRRIHAGEHR